MPKPTAAANAAPMPAPTRRAVLKATGALGTIAALAVPVALLPKAEAAEPDPIFALITEHKRLWAICNGADSDEEANIASATEMGCLDEILRTVPTTREGMAAYVEHIVSDYGFRHSDVEGFRFDAIMASVKAFAMRKSAHV